MNSLHRNACRSDLAQRTRAHHSTHRKHPFAPELRPVHSCLHRPPTGRRIDLSSGASPQKPLVTSVRASKSLSF